ASQRDLFDVVDALGSSSGLAGRLDCGEQESDEDRDDRDHHQQFNERESATAHASYLPREMRRRGDEKAALPGPASDIKGHSKASEPYRTIPTGTARPEPCDV